jgi:hypothetical protein
MIVAMQRLARRPATVMRLWAGVSSGWVAAVASCAWLQIEDQVEAGRDVARDVAGLDCDGTAAAIAKCLAEAEAAVGVSWGDIAAVAWDYEAMTIVAWFFLPPLGLLLAALLALRVLRAKMAVRAIAPRDMVDAADGVLIRPAGGALMEF